MKKIKIKRGQSWSIDVIIGVIVFMLIIAVFYAFITTKTEADAKTLSEQAKTISSKLHGQSNSEISIIEDGRISIAKLEHLCSKSYEEIKGELGVENDFCIYLEDENGNLISIPCSNVQKAGMGNGKDINLTDDGTVCGAII